MQRSLFPSAAAARSVAGAGRIEALVVRTALHGEARAVPSALAVAGEGVRGDHGSVDPAQIGGERQITLVQAEHLPVVAALLGRPPGGVRPDHLRRNVVVAGLNLLAVLHKRPHARPWLRLGPEVLVEVTGPCEPCGWLELELGAGAIAATHGHGGVCGRIVRGGELRAGDTVETAPPSATGAEGSAAHALPDEDPR